MQPTIVQHFRDAARFQPDRFTPVELGQTERVKAVLTCFEPGQFIPVHSPGVDMTLVVLEGEGTIVMVSAGSARGVRARSRLVAVHLVSPPPTEVDHAEVQAKLRHGSWR